ncbi:MULTISPECIES: RidA family protein [unclassified Chelatococcus]|jgi:enamine deaminase RidA (YjgF/YER057c/UK114 family)|uniref:RidA family protein n=1 Tax=unclassified Chelatococcus TaxID=2638111 RepID=UPI001BCDB2BB|nr:MULTISPECIES: RidA family protein [unclassified Chelatococcus]CAH1669512.1 RutC family protein HD_0322 [Hyphomicrobiales bacterium]MBS7698228.1 RidA family protein [Chelatococcus sp. YT9]MBS7738216.1 RidA family protein [Chelatococcus sp. HY11]MBX3545744.1 RidA family protein [Chelatococcus sp.]MBX3559835.1 RidA family protein [Chelatococcus sp.]
MSIERFGVGPRMSEAVAYGNLIFLAGEVAEDRTQDAAGQTQQILAAIDETLAKAGSDKTKILKANIWLSDIRYFADMNKVWDAWVPQGHTPARATVEAKLAAPDVLVEIMVVAAR